MPTTNECQHNAELCLKLASETKEFYAKIALLELGKEFRTPAEQSEPAPRGQSELVWLLTAFIGVVGPSDYAPSGIMRRSR